MKAGAIILSGGKSSRMGTNKALLPFKEKTNIERIRDELRSLFDDIILVTNDPESYEFLKIKTVSDKYPGKGPLAGVHAGLMASNYEENIVVACDMPFVSADLAGTLVLDKLNVRYLEEVDLHAYGDGRLEEIFFNMNFPEEYEDAKKRVELGE